MNGTFEFQSFNKLARLNREIVITEKIDGTNAQILIVPTTELSAGSLYPDATVVEDFAQPGNVAMFVGSRNRWITPQQDNYGFARWCKENFAELKKLGHGRHFGEWWGNGIQRGYGLKEKRFSLFNVARWQYMNGVGSRLCYDSVGTWAEGPACCSVVPTLWRGPMSTGAIKEVQSDLAASGSVVAPGFWDPEGIVIYHTAANFCFKVTLKNDESPKSLIK